MRPAFYTAPPQPEVQIPWDDTAPVRGMDATVPIHQMPPGTAIFLYNLDPAAYGCQTRQGWQVWAQNIAGLTVKSLLPFIGMLGDFSQERLFAVSQNGIYDITIQGADNPTAVVSFPDTSSQAGFCSFVHFTDPSGGQTMLVADSANGIYEYTPAGSVWAKYTTEITFPDSTTCNDIDFLAGHKGRIWLIARDKADAYYLPVGAKNGVATKFQFGSKMFHGGYLVGLWSWSVDGGNGLDDYLVALGKGGDVLVYQGTDPSSANTWSLVGNWFIGSIPANRRVAVEVGGDLILLSAVGVTSTSALLSGVDPSRVEKNVTGKVSNLVREAVREKSSLDYWQVDLLPGDGSIVINTPKTTNERHIQFILNLNRVSEDPSGGWGLWRDVPASTFINFSDEVFFATEDGRVCRMQGSLDDLDINGGGGLPVQFSGLLRFTNLGAPGVYKQVTFVRPTFIASNLISVAAKAVYDFNLSEPNLVPRVENVGGSLWDIAKWDAAFWSGPFSAKTLVGGAGYGVEVAFYIQGETVSQATLASIHGTFVKWKFL